VAFLGPDSETQKIFLVNKSGFFFFFFAFCSLHGCVNYREEVYGFGSVSLK
jgi:hypothetical protein